VLDTNLAPDTPTTQRARSRRSTSHTTATGAMLASSRRREQPMKVLIVCVSVSNGNTRKVADAMADVLDARVIEPD
jgi:hypothetical protein